MRQRNLLIIVVLALIAWLGAALIMTHQFVHGEKEHAAGGQRLAR